MFIIEKVGDFTAYALKTVEIIFTIKKSVQVGRLAPVRVILFVEDSNEERRMKICRSFF